MYGGGRRIYGGAGRNSLKIFGLSFVTHPLGHLICPNNEELLLPFTH